MSKVRTREELEKMANDLLAKADYEIKKATEDKFRVFATKIDPNEAIKFENICATDEATPYEVIQSLMAAYIRLKDPGVVLSTEMKELMVAFEFGIHFKEKFELLDPSLELEVREATYFISASPYKDEGKGKVRTVGQPFNNMRLLHIYDGLMGETEMTENIKEILERTLEEMPVLYKKLRQLCRLKRADSIYELLCKIVEEYDGVEDANEIEATFADCDRSEFGKKMEQIRYKRTMINKMEAFERRQTSLEFPEWTEDDQIKDTF